MIQIKKEYFEKILNVELDDMSISEGKVTITFSLPEKMDDTIHGIVKWFNQSKGLGFIYLPDNTEIFVHYSDIIDTNNKIKNLNLGDKVAFILGTDENGRTRALKVRKSE